MLQCQTGDITNELSSRVFYFQRRYMSQIPPEAYSKGLYVSFNKSQSDSTASETVQTPSEEPSASSFYHSLLPTCSDDFPSNDLLQRDLIKPENFVPKPGAIPILRIQDSDHIIYNNSNIQSINRVVGFAKCYRITSTFAAAFAIFLMLFSFFDIYSTNLFLDSLPTVISIFLLLAAYHYNPIYVVINFILIPLFIVLYAFYFITNYLINSEVTLKAMQVFMVSCIFVFILWTYYQTIRFYVLLKSLSDIERFELPVREYYTKIPISC